MDTATIQHVTTTDDLIHDVQLDYYGKQLASAGSDRRIKIFDIDANGQRQQTAEITGCAHSRELDFPVSLHA